MVKHRDHLKVLEDLLVKEFRACQTLYQLTRQERLALAGVDIARLQILAGQKEALLDRLSNLADTRQALLKEITQRGAVFAGEPAGSMLSLALVSARPDDAERLRRVQEGILALSGQVRDLTEGNHALAVFALDRAAKANLQDTLGEYDQAGLPALFAAVLAARDALRTGDDAAVSNAIDNMENALERLSKSLTQGIDRSQTPRPVGESQPSARPGANLVEAMATLYRQQAAYRAVLRVNQRMLASA